MAKLMCAKCGGKVKMANGGVTPKKVLAKAPVNMYGIPQENMGTSGQYGFGRKGGAVKKMQNGGNVASEKPWKNLGIATAAGSLIGALTSEKGIARRADKADARYKKRQTKKLMKVAPKSLPKAQLGAIVKGLSKVSKAVKPATKVVKKANPTPGYGVMDNVKFLGKNVVGGGLIGAGIGAGFTKFVGLDKASRDKAAAKNKKVLKKKP